MVGTVWLINIVLSSASVALLATLLFIYGRNLREVRSAFALGLTLFALLLLAESAMSIWSFFSMDAQGIGAEVALPMLYLNVAKVSAFSILAAISWG